MTVLIVLVCLLLLGLLPFGIVLQYEHKIMQIWLTIGTLRFRVFPAKEKRQSAKAGKGNKKDTFESHAQVKNMKQDLSRFVPLVRLVIDFLLDFRTKLQIDYLQFRMILAGGDPCDLSINYGRAWAVLGNAMPLLERCFTIKKRDLEIACDYMEDTTKITAYIKMTITVAHILLLGGYHGFRLLRKYFQITKSAKDGALS